MTSQEYWKEVSSIISNLREEIKRGVIEDEDGAREWLEQTVDGHEWVIYTAKSLEMLQHCKHEDDCFDVDPFTPETKNASDVYRRLAYYGLLGDVMDEVVLSTLFEVEE